MFRTRIVLVVPVAVFAALGVLAPAQRGWSSDSKLAAIRDNNAAPCNRPGTKLGRSNCINIENAARLHLAELNRIDYRSEGQEPRRPFNSAHSRSLRRVYPHAIPAAAVSAGASSSGAEVEASTTPAVSAGAASGGSAVPQFESGGDVRKAFVTAAQLSPAPNYGLYVYVLPQAEVPKNELSELTEFFQEKLGTPQGYDHPRTTALMVLPVCSVRQADGSQKINLVLSGDLAGTSINPTRIDPTELYILATNTPLIPRTRRDDVVVMKLGRVAPLLIQRWLSEVQQQLEQGKIESPSDVNLHLESFLIALAAAGTSWEVVIPSAEAAPPSPSCS